MRLTIALATWNRSALLDRTLTEMTQLRIPTGVSWEVLVVNNGCTDDTEAVLARHAEALPLRPLLEPKPGASNARNRAVAEATGEYIVWTDDDVLVEPDWLEAYAAAFARHPEAAVFGGAIEPWFDGEPPAWLRAAFPKVADVYAALDLGPVESRLTPTTAVYGANMATRRRDLPAVPFDPNLGPVRTGRVVGEESALVERLINDGAEGWWVPTARVRHFIPRQRQTAQYLRSYYVGRGRTLARMEPQGGPRLFGRPRWVWRRVIETELTYRLRRPLARPEQWVADLQAAGMAWGLFAETGRKG